MGDLKKNKSDFIAHKQSEEDMLLIETENISSAEQKTVERLRAYVEKFYEMQIEKQLKEKEVKKMARYRTYKNGITGHKYKGLYIIKGEEKGKFAIWTENKEVIKDNILDYDECEWIIDKETADSETMTMMKMLYEKEIYELSALLIELIKKKEMNGELEPKSENLYKWVEKIRQRKVKDREF